MSTINTEGSKLDPDTYIELFDFDSRHLVDAQGIPGPISYFTNTPQSDSLGPTKWRGESYFPLPFQVTGIENKGDGTALSRPQLTVSNVNRFLLAAILTLGDLIGMRVTRWRTFYKFTDTGTEPNTFMHYPEDVWIVSRKIAHSKNIISFEMSSPLDIPGLRLPRKLILKDQIGDQVHFPGVSRVRLR